MSTARSAWWDAINTLVDAIPSSAIEPLATGIGGVDPGAWASIQAAAQRALATPHYREQVGAFIAAWQTLAPNESPSSVVLALRAVAHAIARERRAQTLEVVWTGPVSTQPFRRTAQVLQDVIDQARNELLIVAFAVYDIPEIGQALFRAAQRGVRIALIIESPKEAAGKVAYDGLAAFGPQVTTQARVYRWPADKRPADAAGRSGALHVKCAVADAAVLLISSANLTHYALNLNMELGVLVRGGSLPRQVARHFHELIQTKILARIEPNVASPGFQ
jgi:phosphatidylserine/phosphatidylglycerophosphate/cardiolipin synthase-like enzyme